MWVRVWGFKFTISNLILKSWGKKHVKNSSCLVFEIITGVKFCPRLRESELVQVLALTALFNKGSRVLWLNIIRMWFLTNLNEALFKFCTIALQIIVFSSSGEVCHQGSYGNIAEKDEKLLSQWSEARLHSITHQAGQNTSEIERAELHQQVAKRHQYQQDDDQEKIRGMDYFWVNLNHCTCCSNTAYNCMHAHKPLHWIPKKLFLPLIHNWCTWAIIQILIAHEDDGGNYHSWGDVHTRSTSRPGVDSTKGVIISTIIQL